MSHSLTIMCLIENYHVILCKLSVYILLIHYHLLICLLFYSEPIINLLLTDESSYSVQSLLSVC